MTLAYVAGAFRAKTPWQVEQNVRRAETVALACHRLGLFALCPHTNTRFFDGECSDRHWIDGTLEMMRRCDVVIVLPFWEDSRGTRGEVREALALGLPAFEVHNINQEAIDVSDDPHELARATRITDARFSELGAVLSSQQSEETLGRWLKRRATGSYLLDGIKRAHQELDAFGVERGPLLHERVRRIRSLRSLQEPALPMFVSNQEHGLAFRTTADREALQNRIARDAEGEDRS